MDIRICLRIPTGPGRTRPKYISLELSHSEDIVSDSSGLSYIHSRIVNQGKPSPGSLPIFYKELGWRLLRKGCASGSLFQDGAKRDFDAFPQGTGGHFTEGMLGRAIRAKKVHFGPWLPQTKAKRLHEN